MKPLRSIQIHDISLRENIRKPAALRWHWVTQLAATCRSKLLGVTCHTLTPGLKQVRLDWLGSHVPKKREWNMWHSKQYMITWVLHRTSPLPFHSFSNFHLTLNLNYSSLNIYFLLEIWPGCVHPHRISQTSHNVDLTTLHAGICWTREASQGALRFPGFEAWNIWNWWKSPWWCDGGKC